jgi:membrane fusion protein, multidrug efflux system
MIQKLPLARVLSIGCALALMTSACGKRGGPPQHMGMLVKTAEAAQMDTPVIISAFGNTGEGVSIDVVPQVSGKLAESYFEDGAVVTNGQPLFLIDPSDYAIRVKQAEGAVAADRANVEWNRITVERNQPLLAKELISSQDFDTLKTHLDAATAQLEADEAALEGARLNLSRCTVTVAVSGVCSSRYIDNGNLVGAGQTRLTNIRSYDPLKVDFSVSEEFLPAVRKAMAGGPVRIEIKARGDTNMYAGELSFIDNAVDMQTGTIRLRGLVPNPDLKLWSQQFVEVGVIVDTIPNAIMVPEGCVQYGKQGPYVFVVTKDSTADMRPVEPGVRHNDLIQLISGVSAGESVVVLGQLMLFPGAPVMDMAKMPPPGAGVPAGAAPKGSK